VKVIAAMVEMRDPYTSGHQQRVADLARAIAIEMGLEEEKVNGLHFAALIHDLGKIRVPAEILSKPGRLTESEFSLIQTHSQIGYDVLKDIQFPWPVAQIVLQHHERLDGSGYPQGLKGDAIIPEARILIVADVVEAMASHRPYRPGLGLTAAMDEIKKNRGKFYDPDVVDACVRLFAENKYPPPDMWSKL
jgi:putative nucleotidyltransferase with HDIG domain